VQQARHTIIDWKGLRLQAAANTRFPVGSQVSWLIPALEVRLVDEKLDGYAGRDNLHQALVEAVVPLGGQVTVRVRMPNGLHLVLSATEHIIRKRGIEVGRTVEVSLPAASIHLMPCDGD